MVALQPLLAKGENLRRLSAGKLRDLVSRQPRKALIGVDDAAFMHDGHAFERCIGQPAQVGQVAVDEHRAESKDDQHGRGGDDPAGKPGGMNDIGCRNIRRRHQRNAAHRREMEDADGNNEQQGRNHQPADIAQHMKGMKRCRCQQGAGNDGEAREPGIVDDVAGHLERLHAGKVHGGDADTQDDAA